MIVALIVVQQKNHMRVRVIAALVTSDILAETIWIDAIVWLPF